LSRDWQHENWQRKIGLGGRIQDPTSTSLYLVLDFPTQNIKRSRSPCRISTLESRDLKVFEGCREKLRVSAPCAITEIVEEQFTGQWEHRRTHPRKQGGDILRAHRSLNLIICILRARLSDSAKQSPKICRTDSPNLHQRSRCYRSTVPYLIAFPNATIHPNCTDPS
jgi:hypothetical protein